MESLTTCGLWEHAECCTRVSAARNVSPKASITACERKTSVVPYVKRKTPKGVSEGQSRGICLKLLKAPLRRRFKFQTVSTSWSAGADFLDV